jgi:hypothetical protein
VHVEQTGNEMFVEDMKFANDTSAPVDTDYNSSKRGKTKKAATLNVLFKVNANFITKQM